MADTESVGGNRTGKRKPPGPPRWKPGESGNPAGTSKKQREQLTIRKWFDKHPDEVAEFVALGVKYAKEGNSAYWQQVADRLWGKVKDVIEVQGGPIEIHWPHQFTGTPKADASDD